MDNTKINDREFVTLLRNSKQQVRRESADRMEKLLDKIDNHEKSINQIMPYKTDEFRNAVTDVLIDQINVSVSSGDSYTGGLDGSGSLYKPYTEVKVTIGETIIFSDTFE